MSAVGSECIARLNLRTVRHMTRPSSHHVIITEEKEDHSNRKRIRGRKCPIVVRYQISDYPLSLLIFLTYQKYYSELGRSSIGRVPP